MIKVSIIIPVYNVENYIERCLDSVFSQSYQNIEIVIVEDKSTDRSEYIIRTYIENATRPVKFVCHESNRGLSVARNTGVHASTGDYIYFLDSDDEISSDCIELLLAPIQKNPSIQMVQGATKSIPYKDFYSVASFKDHPLINNSILRESYFRINPIFPGNAWNKLISRDFIINNNLHFEPGIIHEDQLWMFRLVKKAESVYIIQDETYIHYRNPNSIMANLPTGRDERSWAIILKKIVPEIEGECSEGQLKKLLEQVIISYKNFNKDDRDLICLRLRKKMLRHVLFFPLFTIYALSNSIDQNDIDFCLNMLSSYCYNKSKFAKKELLSFIVRKIRVRLAIRTRIMELFHSF